MGDIFAFCQSNGSSSVSNNFSRMCCKSGTTCSVHVFMIVGAILSEPGAFWCFSSSNSFTILSVEIWIGSIDLVGELFKVGKLLQFCLVKMD